eukprot:TRINITY_DN47430_c2_g1_i1.p1 TRINITY_DN47430_c2_g1~~TRINITY_DN47430_c2_g1_i1.p1  ORF type:complete len:848 (-),score=300.64 TRINITY_DN47430_c2_g1_i1:73-2616(-)
MMETGRAEHQEYDPDGGEEVIDLNKQDRPLPDVRRKKPYDPDEDDDEEEEVVNDPKALKAKRDTVTKASSELGLLTNAYVITNTMDVLRSQANSGSEFTARMSVTAAANNVNAPRRGPSGSDVVNKHRRTRSDGSGSLAGGSNGAFSPRNLRMILESDDAHNSASLASGANSVSSPSNSAMLKKRALSPPESPKPVGIEFAKDGPNLEKKVDDLERLQQMVMQENEDLSKKVKLLWKASHELKAELDNHGIETKIEIPDVNVNSVEEVSNPKRTSDLSMSPKSFVPNDAKPSKIMTLGRNFRSMSFRKGSGGGGPPSSSDVFDFSMESSSKQATTTFASPQLVLAPEAASSSSPAQVVRRDSLASKLKSSLKIGGSGGTPKHKGSGEFDFAASVKPNFGLTERDVENTVWADVGMQKSSAAAAGGTLDSIWLDTAPSRRKSVEVANWIIDQKDMSGIHDWEVNPRLGRPTKYITDQRIMTVVTSILRRMNITADELHRIVVEGDETHLTAETIQHLLDAFPTEDVMLTLERNNKNEDPDDLHPVDRVFFRLASVPGIHERLQLWIFKLNLTKDFKGAFDDLVVIDKSLKYLKNNTDVQNILFAILYVSNTLHKLKSNGLKLSRFLESVGISGETIEGKKFMNHVCQFLAINHPEALDFPAKASNILKAVKIQQAALRATVKRLDDSLESIPTYCFNCGGSDKDYKDPLKKELKDLYMEKVPIMLGMRRQLEELSAEAARQLTFLGEDSKSWDLLFKIFATLINAINQLFKNPESEAAALLQQQQLQVESPLSAAAALVGTPDAANTPPKTPTTAGNASPVRKHSRVKSSGSFLLRKNSAGGSSKVEF